MSIFVRFYKNGHLDSVLDYVLIIKQLISVRPEWEHSKGDPMVQYEPRVGRLVIYCVKPFYSQVLKIEPFKVINKIEINIQSGRTKIKTLKISN